MTGVASQLAQLLELKRVTERLADENSALRTTELRDLVIGPVCCGVVRIIDRAEEDLVEYDAALRSVKNPEYRKLLKSARANRLIDRDELLELLAVQGVRPFRTAPGSRLKPGRQCVRAVKPPATGNDIGRVFCSIRPGYADDRSGWVVRPEWVGVYAKPPLDPQQGERP